MSEFEQDIQIDKFALDAECVDQPRRFLKWSEQYADAIAERDRAEQRMEVVKAKVEMEMRRNPQLFNLDKVTDAVIKAAVAMNEGVGEAYEEWIKAKHHVGVIMAARDALEQRKNMIENLVKLYLQGYWADPKVPHEAKRDMGLGTEEKIKEGLKTSPRLAKRKSN